MAPTLADNRVTTTGGGLLVTVARIHFRRHAAAIQLPDVCRAVRGLQSQRPSYVDTSLPVEWVSPGLAKIIRTLLDACSYLCGVHPCLGREQRCQPACVRRRHAGSDGADGECVGTGAWRLYGRSRG